EMVAPFAYAAELREAGTERDSDTLNRDALPPFLAYSPDGLITAPLVYANYGRREDLEALVARGIGLRGAMLLVRYGQIFRGSKVRLAEEFGAVGVLIYSDPADDGFARGEVYPDGPFRPATAVERGSILYLFEYPGDPGTPGRPSLAGAEQLTYDAMGSLPGIPAMCLSHADARPFLESLAGPTVPKGWQGGLPFTYHLGGEGRVRVQLQIESDYRLRRIRNVEGLWPGLQFPDEEIIIGNHRDAWVHGAVDPGTGTAVTLEAARLIAERARAGEPPQRSVRVCFWDGEEFGLLGSTEYGEQFAERLQRGTALYLNLDVAVSGDELRAAGVPVLEAPLRAILAQGGPEFALRSDYGDLGSGSDYTVFLDHLGIPSLDLGSSGPQGVYHSGYDTFGFVKRHIDPDFSRHARMAGIVAEVAQTFSRVALLPYDFAATGQAVRRHAMAVEGAHPQLDLAEIKELGSQIETLGAKIAEARLQAESGAALPLERLLAINHRQIAAERALLLPDGLPGRPWYRHALWAPARDLGYGAAPLPPLSDAAMSGDRAQILEGAALLARALRAHLAALESVRQSLVESPSEPG
ncbi:MAG: M28 family peptidase, partial [Planctomycetes bacterium]|nr:M28 family peptidase [Planctomycetota bacterium]